MDASRNLRCLLWDFGDTLCDERFIWGTGPQWMQVYETFDGGLGDSWSVHDLDTAAFADELSPLLGLPAEEIIDHMVERSRNHIEFFPFTYEFFRARHLPQAIVTVNPDLFSDVIVAAHDLGSCCDAIVTSWEERTIDKSILCRLAIDRIGQGIEPHEALLIDNKQANIDAWESVGGAGWLYTNDDAFRVAVESDRFGVIGDRT